MHSYLVAGADERLVEEKIRDLVKKLKSTPMSFSLSKIADVRELNSYTKLTIDKPTAIIIKNIDQATDEALNAFLKNLEEPQENISYLLTCSSLHKLLPTIVSRCQIITVLGAHKNSNLNEIGKFLDAPTSDKLELVGKIKDREEAIDFVKKIIILSHQTLHQRKPNYRHLKKILLSANFTLKALNANGNVNLQLTNLVINL